MLNQNIADDVHRRVQFHDCKVTEMVAADDLLIRLITVAASLKSIHYVGSP